MPSFTIDAYKGMSPEQVKSRCRELVHAVSDLEEMVATVGNLLPDINAVPERIRQRVWTLMHALSDDAVPPLPPEKGERIPSGEDCDEEGFELVGCEMCDATPRMEDATRGEDGWFCPKCIAKWQAAHDACAHEWTDDTDEFGDACKYCAKCCSREYPDAASPAPAKAEDETQ